MELLNQLIEVGEGRIYRVQRLLLAFTYRAAGHDGELLPPPQKVRVGYGFGTHVLPCLIELRCPGRVRTQHRVEAFDGAGVCVSGEQPP